MKIENFITEKKSYLIKISLFLVFIAALSLLAISYKDFVFKCGILDRMIVIASLILSSLLGLSGFLNNTKLCHVDIYSLAMLVCVVLYFFISIINNFTPKYEYNSLLNYLIVLDFLWAFFISFFIIFDLYLLKIKFDKNK